MVAIEHISPAHSFDRLAEKIEAETGLSFQGSRRRDLKLAIHRMADSQGMDSDAVCIDWLLSGQWEKSKADLCASYLTVGETYFFREPRAFGLLCDYAREKVRNADGANSRLRIWSAGCCTGEEPYSIAMALRQALPELEPGRMSILGTDINSRNLRFARDGVYRHWSFRNTDATHQKLNFSQESEGRFRLNNRIKEMVRFSELNLAAPDYPSVETDTHAMDVIFCRNVLMYFSQPQAQKVIERFRQCLVNGGWLIVSPSEASADMFSGFSGVYYPDAIYFRKSSPSDCPTPRRQEFSTVAPRITETERIDARGVIARAVTATARPKRKASPDADNGALETNAARRARILADNGKTTEAMQCLDQAITAQPTSDDLYFAKALVAMESGDNREAMQSLKRVVYLHPDCIMAHYLMGVIQYSQDKHQEAAKKFETVSGLLAALPDDDLIPRSEGLSSAYLRKTVQSHLQKEFK